MPTGGLASAAGIAGEVFAGAEALGPLGIAAGAVAGLAAAGATAAVALYKMTEAASDSANVYTRLQYQTGSFGRQSAYLQRLGGAIGLSSEQVGGLSQSISERISSDPFAIGTARSMGIFQLPRPFGSVNEGQFVIQIARRLRNIQSDEEATRVARTLGAESLLPLRELSQDQFNRMGTDAARHEGVFNRSTRQDLADFQAARDRISALGEDLEGMVGKYLARPLTAGINAVTDNPAATGQGIWGFLSSIPTLALPGGGGSAIAGTIGSALAGHLFDRQGPVNPDPAAEALDANTRASESVNEGLQALAVAMNGLRTVLGNGDRLPNAIPEGLQGGEYLRRYILEAGGFELSGF